MTLNKLKNIVAASGILLGFLAANAAHAASPCDQMVAFGYPNTGPGHTQMICRLGYVVEYDLDKKLPRYSAEWLLVENIPNKVKRSSLWRASPDIPAGQRAELSDYEGQSEGPGQPMYDRGHLTPYEDLRKNTAQAIQSNTLDQVFPQEFHFNRGLWRSIENKTRGWAKVQQQGLYVMTGPKLTGYTSYIGANKIPVPTHVFKVVIDKQNMQGVAFYAPNVSPAPGVKPETYQVTIAYVEMMTGYNFTPALLDLSQASLLKDRVGSEFK